MPEGNSFLIIFMVLAVAALFFMNSRARKRQAASLQFRNTLAPGQHVMTTSGMFGTVTAVEGDKVTLVTSGGQESLWLVAAIAKLVEDQDEDAAPDDTDTPTDAVEPPRPPTEIDPQRPTHPRDDPSR